jgi:hypothetical protein
VLLHRHIQELLRFRGDALFKSLESIYHLLHATPAAPNIRRQPWIMSDEPRYTISYFHSFYESRPRRACRDDPPLNPRGQPARFGI